MGKIVWKPGTMIYPLPAVLVSCGSAREEYNLVTVSWTGTICTSPPMCYISLRPERYSYGIIRKNMDFVINLTTEALARATDWCGVNSGSKHDKFRATGLTPLPATVVKSPLVKESPANIECIVKEIKELGTHHMFISEVVAVNADEELFDSESGVFRLNDARPLCYLHGRYYITGKFAGKFGFSVEKKKRKKSRTTG